MPDENYDSFCNTHGVLRIDNVGNKLVEGIPRGISACGQLSLSQNIPASAFYEQQLLQPFLSTPFDRRFFDVYSSYGTGVGPF
jgi:hypothetical protein